MNENEIIMENLDVVEDVIEVVPENNGVNFGKVAFGVLVAGAVVALGCKAYKLIKEKKARKLMEAECTTIDWPIEIEVEESEK